MFSLKTKVFRKATVICSFLMLLFGMALSAYQQGSYLLFDIREDAAESGEAGRIAVAASIFKKKTVKTEKQLAEQTAPKSEFESEISVFETANAITDTSQFLILEGESVESKSETSFDEKPKTQSGFFFTY